MNLSHNPKTGLVWRGCRLHCRPALHALQVWHTDRLIVTSWHGDMTWIPKSLAEFEEEGPNGRGTLTLPEWLAKEKELI